MSFKKVSAATIIILSLTACSNNQPNDIPSITSSSNSIQKNNGNSADNNSNSSNNNSNTSNNNNNTSSNNSNTSNNNSNTSGNNSNTPGNNSNTPGNNSNTPGNNSNTPGNNSNTPGNNSNTPGNNSNTPGNNSNTPGNNSNTSGNNSNTSGNNSNTSGNATPRVDFSVSYGGLKTNAIEDIQKLAKDLGVPGATVKSYNVTLGNQSSSGSNINLSGYPLKELKLNQNFQETAIANASGNNYTITRSGKAHIYRQNYSLIAGINPTNTTVRGSGVNESEKLDDTYILIKGQTTQTLPTAGKFNYSGIASDGVSQGKLAYSVNFDNGKGSGTITGIGSDINLHEASIREGSYTNEIDNTEIKGYGIQGSSNRGDYALGFFGPNAEEIVGTVNDGEIGFAGSH
ncbi:TPA: factor H binding protein domain-containing protein [Neisseria subflava]